MIRNKEAVQLLLSDVLRGIGVKTIDSNTVELLIEIYHDLDILERKKIRQALIIMGYQRVSDALEEPVSGTEEEASFACPILKTNIVSPCEAHSCRYHIDNPSGFNCLLIFSNRKELSSREISNILGITQYQVTNIRHGALRKMRQSAVTVAQQKSELRSEFTFLKTSRVCGVCEKAINGQPFYKEEKVVICSVECIEKRNPAEVILESRYGIPANKLIRWVTKNFDSLETAAQSLGFPESVLTRALTA